MRIAKLILVFVLCLSLCGCASFGDDSYILIESRPPQSTVSATQNVTAADYAQLYDALAALIENGASQQVISLENYDRERMEEDVKAVTEEIRATHPIAAYAVDRIAYTIGTNGGVHALSVQITYLHDRSQISKIVKVADNNAAKEAVKEALNNCDTGIVLQIENYAALDFEQVVENHAMQYPEYVMEMPQVAVSVYPEEGKSRVVELKFSYQTRRELLKSMQSQVSPVFASAVLYVSGEAADRVKFSQLYSFLMERYEYKTETSITPAYSLLRQGVGDSKAFATVYAAMCRQAGLECMVVSGTRNGESCYWNIVRDNWIYYHVDLLQCAQNGDFVELGDAQMEDYVWATEFYPACGTDFSKENNEN